MANANLRSAKKAKNDEFYTQYIDIEKEVNSYVEYNPDAFRGKTILLPCDDPEWSNFTKYFSQRFEKLGLKKLISTSFASNSKGYDNSYEATSFESSNPQYDENKTINNGKIFTLTHDVTDDGKVNIEDIEWTYLKGDGDFNSDEIKKLRDEADIIITNPPFSLFRKFLAWIMEDNKQFLIIGNLNSITYKEVFPLMENNKIWLGPSITSGDREFEVPLDIVDMDKFTGEIRNGKYFQKVVGVRWFTNLDHGKRHQEISLMTEEDVIKFSTKKPFDKYDNYNAIEVPYVKFIPNDYTGVMGVPISFMDKYSPLQFEIVGRADANIANENNKHHIKGFPDKGGAPLVGGKFIYKRILIKHKKVAK